MNPGRDIPRWPSQRTASATKTLRMCPNCGRFFPQIEDLVEGRTIVAHHATFDRNFLWTLRQPWICTLELARKAYAHAPSHRLGRLVEYLGLRQQLTSNVCTAHCRTPKQRRIC